MRIAAFEEANSYQILVIDDDLYDLNFLKNILSKQGYKVGSASSAQLALESVSSELPDLILLNPKMLEMDAYEFYQLIKTNEKTSRIPVVFISALDEISDKERVVGVEGVEGEEYITKPFQAAVVLARVETQLRIQRLKAQLEEKDLQLQEEIDKRKRAEKEFKLNTQRWHAIEILKQMNQASIKENNETQQKINKLKKIAAKSIGLDDVYCFSDSMRQIIKDTQKYHSDRSIPVMIHGETGTGKELIAKMIHYGDLDVVDTPFVALNCAAITNGLFESELFGYEAGAFTGGLKQGQKGKFDLAKGGTLFFDEIAEIPLDLQGKLLRVLEEKEFYRVGGLKKIKTDVRIICATNANLKTRVQNGTFREDLYYRLRVGYIYVPTLRERSEAILQFASVFLKQASELRQKSFKRISPEAGKILQSYSWPGNIRELKNVIDAIVLMHDYPELKPLHLDMITGQMKDLSLKSKEMSLQERRQIENTIIEDLSSIGKIKENISLPEIISQVESLSIKLTKDGINLDSIIEEVINRALYINNGNKTATANYLGISRTALYNRLNKQKTKPRE